VSAWKARQGARYWWFYTIGINGAFLGIAATISLAAILALSVLFGLCVWQFYDCYADWAHTGFR